MKTSLIFNLKKTIFLGICIVVGIGFLMANKTNAQENTGLDLTVSPPVIELNAKPGDVLKQKFRLRNNLSQKTDLRIDVKKLSSDRNSGEPVPAEPSSSDEYISWLKVDSSDLSVYPKEWSDVNFTIEVPENAAYGYYYVVRIQPANQGKIKGSGAKVQGEVYVVVLLNVKKDGAIAKATLTNFSPNTFLGEYLPVEFTAKVANKGNVHLKPSGNIFIRSAYQKDVAILDINAGKATVLPGGSRTYTSAWNDGFIVRQPVMEGNTVKLDSKGKPATHIVINWDKLTHFRVGPYTATLLMVYDDGTRDATIEGTTTFWLIPYTAITVIAVTLVVLVILIRFVLKWYIRRELKKASRR